MRRFFLAWMLYAFSSGCYDLEFSPFPDAGPDAGPGDETGSVAWVKQAGGAGLDSASALVAFGNGTFVAAGAYRRDGRDDRAASPGSGRG